MLQIPVNPGYRKTETREYLSVKSCFYMTAREEMVVSHRFLEYCEMIYVTGGKIYLAVGKQEYVIEAGDVFLIPCYRTIDGIRHSAQKTTFCTVEFICSDILLEEIAEQVISVQEDAYFIEKLMDKMYSSLSERGNEDNFEGDAMFLSILYSIRQNCRNSRKKGIPMLNLVMEYINKTMGEMLTLDEIASHFGYNKDYLLRIFREQYGITIKKYINDRKLAMVKQMLTTTDMSVEKIGESAGFENAELFKKYFKYHEKVTPQRYRSMNR